MIYEKMISMYFQIAPYSNWDLADTYATYMVKHLTIIAPKLEGGN